MAKELAKSHEKPVSKPRKSRSSMKTEETPIKVVKSEQNDTNSEIKETFEINSPPKTQLKPLKSKQMASSKVKTEIFEKKQEVISPSEKTTLKRLPTTLQSAHESEAPLFNPDDFKF